MCSKISTCKFTASSSPGIDRLREWLQSADAVVIGAGAGLSASAGFAYRGERFRKYFSDFGAKYGFDDMYTGGFYPYDTLEEHWAYWSRYIYINRYMDAPKPVYRELYELVKEKDYFVLTTNVDHCFQKAGFDKKRLFYTQGDYGLWQCSEPCHKSTYDNFGAVNAMLLAQGYTIAESGELRPPAGGEAKMRVPGELVPHCPVCGRPMSMNLRADATFVEDEGWHAAAARYEDFLRRHAGMHVLFLELGVGGNTPGIIKYPFWRMTYQNRSAVYACLNAEKPYIPPEIASRSLALEGDIRQTLKKLCAADENRDENDMTDA